MRRGPGEGAVDINIPQFSLPNPTGGKDLLEGAQLRLFRGHRYELWSAVQHPSVLFAKSLRGQGPT
jgi:hypothetical protein